MNHHAFDIHVAITDNGRSRVGLNISGHDGGNSIVELVGLSHNTYTGETILSNNGQLNLLKGNNIIGVGGKLTVREGSSVFIFRDEQINNKSTVTLSSRRGEASYLRFFGEFQKSLRETVASLVVSGNGIVDFGSFDYESSHGLRHLFLDDLIITEGSKLIIQSWEEGRDHLLVKKSSKSLEAALKKIEFMGYDPNAIHLEEYNKEYWAISGAPEPSAYGAGLALSGLSLVLWRRKRKGAAASQWPCSPIIYRSFFLKTGFVK